MAATDTFVKHRPGAVGRQHWVKKKDKRVSLRSKRWHVLEILAKAEEWTSLVELGVFTGPTFFHLLATCKRMTVIGVDTYALPEGTHLEDGYTDYGRPDMDQLRRLVTEQAAKYGDRARLIIADTVETAATFEDRSVDCVFIDADHRTERVLADFDAWKPKARKWVIGHDWHWDTVKAAVMARTDKPTLFPDHVWGIRV